MENSSITTYRYCGRIFTALEMLWIRNLITDNPKLHRLALSRVVCQELRWLSLNGRLKDMSCRVAMLRMHRDGLICLPAPRRKYSNGQQWRRAFSSLSDPQKPISLPAGQLGQLVIRPVAAVTEARLWNELIQRYHYLGHKPLPGAQIKYLVFSACGDLLAVLGFAAAAWKVAPRDQFIRWDPAQRARNLHLIVNNARFLILPWVTSKNLASRILSLAAKQLPFHWQTRYNYQPVLLETFVQKDKFKGTCYRAANWILLGQTQGRGKLDRLNKRPLPVKDIFVYPLNKNFRPILCSV